MVNETVVLKYVSHCSSSSSSSSSSGSSWRAIEVSETLSGVYKFELVRYIYIYMYGGAYAIIVAHATHT